MKSISFIFTYSGFHCFYELRRQPSLVVWHLLCGLKGRELFVDMLYVHMKTNQLLIFNRGWSGVISLPDLLDNCCQYAIQVQRPKTNIDQQTVQPPPPLTFVNPNSCSAKEGDATSSLSLVTNILIVIDGKTEKFALSTIMQGIGFEVQSLSMRS